MANLALLAFLLAACAAGPTSLQVGDPAPDFSLPEVNGDTVELQQIGDGRPVLLYFHMAVG